VQLPYCDVTPALDCNVWEIVGRSLLLLWKDWPKDMQLSSFNRAQFVLSGECPHCRSKAAFPSVTEPYVPDEITGPDGEQTAVAVCRCHACNGYVLGILKTTYLGSGRSQWKYHAHYPLGWPNDAVPDEIPDELKTDLKEALRCRWVKAYNATIEMCGRALEGSCIQLGAPPDLVLSKMIDWVYAQGRITKQLCEMAHKIKLSRNLAAHASDRTLTQDDADAVLEFTDEYFHHIYTMPAKMVKFDLDKPGKKKTP
jgi:hypothetical protein